MCVCVSTNFYYKFPALLKWRFETFLKPRVGTSVDENTGLKTLEFAVTVLLMIYCQSASRNKTTVNKPAGMFLQAGHHVDAIKTFKH